MIAPDVTWIKVEKPTFDLVRFLLTSLTLVSVLAAVAFVLGALHGLILIARGRRWRDERLDEDVSLRLHPRA